MKKLLLIAILACTPAYAATTSAVPFLRLPAGARAVGMGEAFTAAANDATALYWNPALLATANGNSASFMHAAYLAGTSYDYGALNIRGDKYGLAAGIQRFTSGDMTEFDDAGIAKGSFDQTDLALLIGGGLEIFDGYTAGITGKYVHSAIKSGAETYAFDAGAATPYYGGTVRFAAALANIGGKIRYDSVNEDLPLILRVGASWRMAQKLLLTADGGFPRAGSNYFAAGLEYTESMDKINLAGRLGYNSRTAGDISGTNGLSAGLGAGFGRINADYALTLLGDLGTAHRFSLTFGF